MGSNLICLEPAEERETTMAARKRERNKRLRDGKQTFFLTRRQHTRWINFSTCHLLNRRSTQLDCTTGVLEFFPKLFLIH